MPRRRPFLPTVLVALACLGFVSFDGPLHHHAGPAALDCAVCHAAAAPAVEAPEVASVPAPEPADAGFAPTPLRTPGRLAGSASPARAPPPAFSFEA